MKKQYHWLIAGLLLLQLFAIGGIYNNLTNLFVIPVTEDMGIARSTFSLAVSMKGLTAFIGTFFSGALLSRFSYRKMVSILMTSNCIALIIMASSKNVVTLGIGIGMLGLGDGICLTAGPPQIIRRWFHKHQGLVLGCVSAATGLGGSAFCLVFSGIIESNGWQMALLTGAVIYSVVAVLLFAVIRDDPEKIGLKPYGEGQCLVKKKTTQKEKWEGFAVAQVTKMPAFYLLLLASFLSCICVYSLSLTVVPHLRNEGYTPTQAATVQSTLMLLLAGTKLGLGALSDWIGGKRITLICVSCITASLAMMALSHNVYLIWVSAALLACGLPLTMLTVPLLIPDLFGGRAQTVLMGVFMSTSFVATMVSAPISNAVFDYLGTYRPMYCLSAAIGAFLLVLYGLIFLMVSRAKKKLCV